MTKTLVAVFGIIGLFATQDYAFAQAPAPGVGAPGAKRPAVRRKVIRKPAAGSTMPAGATDPMAAPGGDFGAAGSLPPPADATATAGAAAASVVGSDSSSGAPYKMRVSLGLDLSGGSTSSTTKTGSTSVKGTGNLPTFFSVAGTVGYLITPKIEIGGTLGVAYNSLKSKGADDKEVTNTQTRFKIGLEPRYNIFDINTNKVVPYVGAVVGYTMESSSTSPAPDPDPKQTGPSGLYFGGSLGCHYFMTRHVALTGAFELNIAMTTESEGEGDTKRELSTTSTEFNYLKVGLSVYL